MIGAGTTIRGNLNGDEDLTVEGKIEGSVRLSKDLNIAQSAVLAAEVEAQNVAIDGTVSGNITASQTVQVAAGATVVGDVTTPRLHIAEGARFKGRVNMDFEIPGHSS